MSNEFIAYSAIVSVALLITLLIVGPRNVTDFRRCVGWYLIIFSATYLVRPATSQLLGDTLIYQLLRIGCFEDHWYLMATAVPLALLSFGIGYRAGTPSRKNHVVGFRDEERRADPHKVRVLIYFMIVLGYLSAIICLKTGTFGAEPADMAGSSAGVYKGSTAWFALDDLFVSTGTILYYIATGRLGMSLLLSTPWLAGRLIYGHGRSHLLGHFFSLMAVFFLRLDPGLAPE